MNNKYENKMDPQWDINYTDEIDHDYFMYLCEHLYKNNRYMINLLLALGNFEDWEYAGGDTGRHYKYFKLKFKGKRIKAPDHEENCPCSHDIKENCYLYNKEDGRLIVVGNCCIKKFIKKCGRTCEDCEKPHRNRKINKCNECKKTVCLKCFKKKNPKYQTCYNCWNGNY